MRNLLSPHEIATLFVIQHAPEQVAPSHSDAVHLQHANLVQVVSAHAGDARLVLTSKGRELLKRLKTTISGGYDLESDSYAHSN